MRRDPLSHKACADKPFRRIGQSRITDGKPASLTRILLHMGRSDEPKDNLFNPWKRVPRGSFLDDSMDKGEGIPVVKELCSRNRTCSIMFRNRIPGILLSDVIPSSKRSNKGKIYRKGYFGENLSPVFRAILSSSDLNYGYLSSSR
jgi:hypothetical protein